MSHRPADALHPDLPAEQRYVSMLYSRLDDLRERLSARRDTARMEEDETPGRLTHRDNLTALYNRRLRQLDAVENGLCFGRLDTADTHRYIGRIGIFDTAREPLLIDWRADAARPFYTATAARPGDVTRRRHIRTTGRRVTELTDEVLDLAAPQDGRRTIAGEAALLAALESERTGRMRDIVETIQGEQDEIIRDGLDGVLIVEGGPGTGKTAVALHRAAYLLYEHRARLASRGVLLIGPNQTFLDYISEVLPGLAETDVLLRTVGTLYPGVTADRAENPEAVAVKGDVRMIEVMAAAVADRQRLPVEPVEMDTEYGTLSLDRETCAVARDKARATGRRHNAARPVFAKALVAALAEQVAERIGTDPLGGDNLLDAADVDEIAAELAGESDVQAVLDWLWPVLTPQQLLAGLLGGEERLRTAAPHLSAAQRESLRREPHSGWTVADVPLLDEAAELLGLPDDRERRDADRRRAEERAAYAQGVLDIAMGSRSIDMEDEDDPEILMATDLLDAALLGERHTDTGHLTTAERAAADRTWTFGHIVVDEAQELSAMAWRMLMRRSVARSMTIVGDLAQSGSPAGTTSWRKVLEPYAEGRIRHRRLTVGYRTPAEIMAEAAVVLAEIDPALRAPEAVRSTGVPPWRRTVDADRLPAEVAGLATEEAARAGRGSVGVIASRRFTPGVAEAVAAAGDADRVTVTAVDGAKGLEFDAVVVVDPAGIVAESVRGRNDLYVALTRATQRLGVVDVVLPAEARTGHRGGNGSPVTGGRPVDNRSNAKPPGGTR
ncbi:AAA family ATPase [Stackebrandtia albiflava]